MTMQCCFYRNPSSAALPVSFGSVENRESFRRRRKRKTARDGFVESGLQRKRKTSLSKPTTSLHLAYLNLFRIGTKSSYQQIKQVQTRKSDFHQYRGIFSNFCNPWKPYGFRKLSRTIRGFGRRASKENEAPASRLDPFPLHDAPDGDVRPRFPGSCLLHQGRRKEGGKPPPPEPDEG